MIIEHEQSTDYVLQAALTGEEPVNWIFLSGISYPSEEELNEAYEQHFRRIDGQGSVYRKVKVEQAITVTLLP